MRASTREYPPAQRGSAVLLMSPLASFNQTATVMRFIAQNQVHVNGAVRFP